MSQSDTPTHGRAAALTPSADAPALAVAANLHELTQVLAGFSDHLYTRTGVGPFRSTIGQHTRHCLDHNVALLDGLQVGTINYENRARGTMIETDRTAAITLARQLHDRTVAIDRTMLEQSVVVMTMFAADGPSVQVRSTVARELAFALSHTIHHNAIIAAIARLSGAPLPERFGFAPSTLAYLDGSACVQ